MAGAINNTGATGGSQSIPAGGKPASQAEVDKKDADAFANQLGGAGKKEKEEVKKDELLDLMKKNSFNEFSEKQKEMTEEIKKDLQS